MARLARREYLDPLTTQITHAVARCVRRAFLCGNDPVTGQSFEHRRQWIQDRLELLASAFAIDCLTFSVMSNHVHLVLRNRPDLVREWTDEEVASRWLRLCPPDCGDEALDAAVAMLVNNPQKIAELRVRLSDISWWMRLLTQSIARRANREDDCTGRFWEGRFKAQLLLDEAAVLACAMYVDLNPIRAAMAESLDASEFTGAKARIDDLKESIESGPSSLQSLGAADVESSEKRWERSSSRQRSGWLSPVEIDTRHAPVNTEPSPCGRRASLKGFLPLSLSKYLELLDWTGRQLRTGKRGAIASHIAPVLQQLGIKGDRWLELAKNFGKLFKRAVGSSASLSDEARQRGQRWLQAPGADAFD